LILLRISQDKEDSLIKAFSKLLKEINKRDLKGKLIILYENKFEISELE